MHLLTGVGLVEIEIWQGEDPADKHWGIPVRERWGLKAHQQMSPALEEKLAFTVTLTGSFADAALVAAKWSGGPADDSVIHALVQRLGAKAEEKTQERLKEVPVESQPQRRPTELAILEIDGWHARFRGPGWGKKKTKQERVEWHELKTGVFYRQEQAVRKGDRGILSEKIVVRWQGEPLDFGQRLNWEALRGGLARAKETLVLADGGPWIWNLKADRWSWAIEGLDFYHGSLHLWELGRAYCGGDEPKAKRWVESRLHKLRHGQEERVLKEIGRLKPPRGQAGKTVRKQKNYFDGQLERMHYKELADRGWPIGSGAVESACRQSQCRFKRAGQFWTQSGLRHLSALDEARRNDHWDELWLTA
jgi:hypothetical protein